MLRNQVPPWIKPRTQREWWDTFLLNRGFFWPKKKIYTPELISWPHNPFSLTAGDLFVDTLAEYQAADTVVKRSNLLAISEIGPSLVGPSPSPPSNSITPSRRLGPSKALYMRALGPVHFLQGNLDVISTRFWPTRSVFGSPGGCSACVGDQT